MLTRCFLRRPASVRRSAFTNGSTAARTNPSRSRSGSAASLASATAISACCSRSSSGGFVSSGMMKRPQRRARSPRLTRLEYTDVGTARISAPMIGVTHQK